MSPNRIARAALALCLLGCAVAGAAAAAVAQQALIAQVPACAQLTLRIIGARPQALRPGGKQAILVAKVANRGPATVTGIGVRLDLPTGLVAWPKRNSRTVVTDGGATAYWTGLTLKPGQHGTLTLKARACTTATPGTFPVTGAVYLVNATSNVACYSPGTAAAKAGPVRPSVRAWGVDGGEGQDGGLPACLSFTDWLTCFATQCHTGTQVRIKPAKSMAAAEAAPPCPPTPAPTPDNAIVLRGEMQRLVDGEFVGYTTTSTRRRLQWASEVSAAAVTACWSLCSAAGYTPTFYFSVERAGAGACYCSQDRCVM